MSTPRILIGAPASGSGKTMLTCGILQVLKNRGLNVASFKCGPDYIDPMFHSKILGTKSRNLDTFFTGKEITRYLLSRNSRGMDMAVMEGVMGYYDGVGGITTQASAYDLARITDTPAILILNCKGMSVSLGAFLKGFLEYRKDSHIEGVILNQISPMMYQRIKNLLEDEFAVTVLGYVPQVDDCVIESRHLGLILPQEVPQLHGKIENLAKVLEQTLNVDGIIRLAQSAGEVEEAELELINPAFAYRTPGPLRIGLAEDDAFCFFYEDNLRLLEEMGATLVPFSPLKDEKLPKGLHGLLLYGGYPELHGRELEANISMRESIYQMITEGMPCMAECGGFMYLHETMEDQEGRICKMTGIIPGGVYKTPTLKRFGYITLTLGEEVFGKDTGNIPAHEFHYYDSPNCGDGFLARKPVSNQTWNCMHNRTNLFAGFPHIHYYGNPSLPMAFLEEAANYKERRQKG